MQNKLNYFLKQFVFKIHSVVGCNSREYYDNLHLDKATNPLCLDFNQNWIYLKFIYGIFGAASAAVWKIQYQQFIICWFINVPHFRYGF